MIDEQRLTAPPERWQHGRRGEPYRERPTDAASEAECVADGLPLEWLHARRKITDDQMATGCDLRRLASAAGVSLRVTGGYGRGGHDGIDGHEGPWFRATMRAVGQAMGGATVSILMDVCVLQTAAPTVPATLAALRRGLDRLPDVMQRARPRDDRPKGIAPTKRVA